MENSTNLKHFFNFDVEYPARYDGPNIYWLHYVSFIPKWLLDNFIGYVLTFFKYRICSLHRCFYHWKQRYHIDIFMALFSSLTSTKYTEK